LTLYECGSTLYIDNHLYIDDVARNNYGESANIIKVLSNSNRVKVIDILSCGENK